MPLLTGETPWPEIQKFAVRLAYLFDGVNKKLPPERVWRRAADLANAALRVADSYAARYEGDE